MVKCILSMYANTRQIILNHIISHLYIIAYYPNIIIVEYYGMHIIIIEYQYNNAVTKDSIRMFEYCVYM